MTKMEKTLKSARRRLVGQSWLNHTVWCVTLGLAVATILLGIEKIRPDLAWNLRPEYALGGGAGGGLVLAALVAIFRRPDELVTANQVDLALGLKDRLSSMINLPADLAESAAGACLKAETEQALEHVELADAMPIRRPRRLWMPVLPLVVAGLVMLAPEMLQKKSQATLATNKPDELVAKKTEALAKKLAEQRKAQAEKVSAPTAELMAQLQKAAEELAKSPPSEKAEALAALNQLSDAVKERQKQMNSAEKMAAQLQQMKNMASDGPADEFAKDLAKGKFNDAANELKSLMEKAQNGKLSDEEKKQLQQQLGDMAKQLEKMASLEEKKKQLEEALKNGGLSKEQFQEEMAKLNQQAANMKQLQQLAQQMQQAQQAMQQGNMEQASQSLQQARQQLEQMAQEMADTQSLDEALADLQGAKDAMAQDGKEGNQLGDMNSGNALGDMMNMQNGNGLNRGRGEGDRPEAPDKTSAYDTRVKMELKKGKFQLKGFGDPGQQSKGKSVIDGGEIEAAVSEASADALTQQRIPRRLQKNVRDYFDQIQNPK
ncbi:MAG: hypothetical protein ACKO5E_02030 [bacterium]